MTKSFNEAAALLPRKTTPAISTGRGSCCFNEAAALLPRKTPTTWVQAR